MIRLPVVAQFISSHGTFAIFISRDHDAMFHWHLIRAMKTAQAKHIIADNVTVPTEFAIAAIRSVTD
jgi:hypothetical protein